MARTGPRSADTRANQFVLPHGAKSTRPLDGRSREFVKHDTHNGPHLTGDQYASYPRKRKNVSCLREQPAAQKGGRFPQKTVNRRPQPLQRRDDHASYSQSTSPSSRFQAFEQWARHDAGVCHYGVSPNLDFSIRPQLAACVGSHEHNADWRKSRRVADRHPNQASPFLGTSSSSSSMPVIVTAKRLPGGLGRLDHIGSVTVSTAFRPVGPRPAASMRTGDLLAGQRHLIIGRRDSQSHC
ncbi:hypothetical protein B0J12DRAFT_698397 [Macrophomina phaseolina]|uniref:Uncharacterized protein n=1 Tax=Macrophomina phaseolina TaxID=35725 RepID=A0ABQ8GE18_9PEZI|nr:hypothetical protein B0J12DRAFT_698397 [Macrophomina phaseolina]